ncbi:MAG: ABC transporter permease [Bacteroidetes bacterium]|nr:ABC transporter permease [Bacteroidota bacterium]
MFKNYLTTTIRNLIRQKGYSIINILGLSIGLAAFILIVLFVRHELSYDRFHENANRIYRVCIDGMVAGDPLNVAVSAPPAGPAMIREYPEIIAQTRIKEMPQTVLFNYQGKKFYQDGLLFVDSSFFKIFSFNLLRGNPTAALVEPYSLVLTETTAIKYFGSEDPIGKMIKMNDKSEFRVTGIVADPPSNAHFGFKVLASFSTMIKQNGAEAYENWGTLSLHTYVLLAKGVDPKLLNQRFPDLYLKYMTDLKEMDNIRFEPYLQPITRIHLHSHLMAEIEPNSDIAYIYTFMAIAAFILLIACINFMNLSTARSVKRSKEVGLRKVVGATRNHLILQFIGESALISLISTAFALLIVELLLPVFNHVLDQSLTLTIFTNGQNFLSLLLLALIVGLMAGSYPAFYLSAFRPIRVLKGTLRKGNKKSTTRNLLVIVQFTISIFLIICTGIIYYQLTYLRHKKLGFDKSHMVIVPLRGERLLKNAEYLKSQFKQLSIVENLATSRFVPGRDMDGTGYIPEGYDDNNPVIFFTNTVGFDYLETMQMEMVEGRAFSKEYATDSMAIIVNETLVKKMGWDQPIGKKIVGFVDTIEVERHVIGVVKDFHFRSLHAVVEPTVMFITHNNARNLNIRLKAGNYAQQIETLREKWEQMEGALPFDYYFLDEDFDSQYQADQRLGELFIYFTLIAIFIACLGLFGLASYNAEQRTREIGIRKVLGSSVEGIILLLSRQFSLWIVIANIIAWPLAWLFLNRWLANFAYRIHLANYWYIFILAALITLFIAYITVVYQAIKAALANPVQALKYE